MKFHIFNQNWFISYTEFNSTLTIPIPFFWKNNNVIQLQTPVIRFVDDFWSLQLSSWLINVTKSVDTVQPIDSWWDIWTVHWCVLCHRCYKNRQLSPETVAPHTIDPLNWRKEKLSVARRSAAAPKSVFHEPDSCSVKSDCTGSRFPVDL